MSEVVARVVIQTEILYAPLNWTSSKTRVGARIEEYGQGSLPISAMF